MDSGEDEEDGEGDQEYEIIGLDFKCAEYCAFHKAITGKDSSIREIE